MKKIYYLIYLLFYTIVCLNGQSINGSIQFGGLTRQYSLYVPASYNPQTASPLVLNLHGYTSSNWQQELYSNMNPIADTAGFLIVYPQGTTDASGNTFWNVGFFPSSIDDTGFLLALIDSISDNYNINQNRIYSTGMSNGGFMSYQLACESGRIAAIASVTGSMTHQTFGDCAPQVPIPVMQVHGTADPTVPYAGNTLFLPVEDVVEYWVNINQCNPVPSVTNVPNTNILDGATAEHSLYSGGVNDATVEFYRIINGGHTWPGASITVGVTCMDFNASKEIWRFFSQYSNPTTSLEEKTNPLLSFTPNPVENELNIKTAAPGLLTITDYTGKIIRHFSVSSGETNINIQEFPAGLYFMIVESNKKTYTQRFAKK